MVLENDSDDLDSDMLDDLADDARNIEELEGQQQQRLNNMKERKAWLVDHPISNHFDVEKNFAEKYRLSLTSAKKMLRSDLKKYEVENKDIPTLIKELKKHRRTLKGEKKKKITKSIDNLIDAYSDHLDKSIDNIYWISKYKSALKDMTCDENAIIKLSYIHEEDIRRSLIDELCKHWEAKLDRNDTPYNSDYSQLSKTMKSSKRSFRATVKKYMANVSNKEVIKHHILKSVCESPGISSRQIHERLPKKLFNKTTPSIISKMAIGNNITAVNGAFYKFNDDIKKDIYAYTAAFIDSDGYITMDKKFNPRVGLVATGDRGKAFMIEMHKSLGCGRLHLDQKSPQNTRPVNRLNFYSGDDVIEVLSKCRPHFKMKGKNADILMELIRMKKSYKKEEWYKNRREELFKLMKYENHKDHVGYDFGEYGINPDTVAKLYDNCKMGEMDKIEGVIKKALVGA
tara:strand:- start:21268 stop:22638 length:1371 start_codon:yes stop_codon:yes gene_type:complete